MKNVFKWMELFFAIGGAALGATFVLARYQLWMQPVAAAPAAIKEVSY